MDKFEDLIAWQKARELNRAIYSVTSTPPFARDHGLRSQVQRASVSVMANIAEGYERHRLAEFHQALSIAKASCAELRSHLYVALDVGYIPARDFEVLLKQAEEVARIIGGLRASVQRRRNSEVSNDGRL